MTRKNRESSRGPAAEEAEDQADSGSLQRWAELIARGEVRFPEGLRRPEQEWLVQEVRRLRSTRLAQFIARQIALDLHRTARRREDE